MYNSSVTLKLIDFGLSKEGAYKHCQLSAEYLAPEILQQMGHDGSVDVWSIGVIFYEILSGKHPFKCTDNVTTIKSIISGQITRPTDCSNVAWDFLKSTICDNRLPLTKVKKHPLFNPSFESIIERDSPIMLDELMLSEFMK